HDIRLDQCASRRIGFGDYGCPLDGGMSLEAVFDLAWAYAVSRALEYIIAPARMPIVSIAVDGGQVAGHVPVAVELRLGGVVIPPVSQEQGGVGMAMYIVAAQGNLADRAGPAGAPAAVEHGHPVSRKGFANAAGAGGPAPVAVAYCVAE